MAGIAQVFLTHDELEAMLEVWDTFQDERHAGYVTPKMTSGFDKLELALAPVACDTASGCKIPDRGERRPDGSLRPASERWPDGAPT